MALKRKGSDYIAGARRFSTDELQVPNAHALDRLPNYVKARGVMASFHYVPLHSSAGGRRYSRVHGRMANTDAVADRLVRLPLWAGMSEGQALSVVESVALAVQAPIRAASI